MSNLPTSLPIFPLAGTLLLPGGLLPLNIFEPRYIAMVEDAMKSSKMIGMVQPTGKTMLCGTPVIQPMGCAGEITQCEQQPDGRYHIMLSGCSRFRVLDEMTPLRGYRRVHTEWLQDQEIPFKLDRRRLMPALKRYLTERGVSCDWSAAECCPDDRLVTTLAMICPFSAAEQYALLEAPDLASRAELLTALLEIPCPDCAPKH